MSSCCSSLLLFTSSFLLFLSSSSSLNITHILDSYPNYSYFNSLLSKYGVASQINTRQTITLLCPSNSVLASAVSSLGNSPSPQTIYNVLSYHVLLDYYDLPKLKTITNGTSNVPTLFQSTGLASGDNGFLNITDVHGVPKCGLPNKGSTLTATIGSPIVLQPYSISLLTIDSVLVPLDAASPSPSPTPSLSPASTPSSAPSPSTTSSSAPAPSSVPSSSPSVSPTPSTSLPAAEGPGSATVGAPASSPKGSSAASVFVSHGLTVFTCLAAAMLLM